MQEYITKKQLLEQCGLSYGQLYRWKRMGLIPREWFIKKSAVTGQETVLPKNKILKRIEQIEQMMESHSLEQIAQRFAFDSREKVIDFQRLYSLPFIKTEYVTTLGNYFKKDGYSATELMLILCCADVAGKEHFTTRQYVDILRYALPLAEKCQSQEMRCIIFAAGGDFHIALYPLGREVITDSGIKIYGSYNFESMWDKLSRRLYEDKK